MNDKPDGTGMFVDASGNEYQGEFRDGELHGIWTGWWENGAKKKEAEFNQGVQLRGEYFPLTE